MFRALALVVSLAGSAALAQNSQPLNEFGLALQREAARAEPGRNIMTSPVALYQALGMALVGTGGATRDRLATLMDGESAMVTRVNDVNYFCQRSLNTAGPEGSKLPRIQIANAAWDSAGFGADGGLRFSTEYAERLAGSYLAQTGSLNFSSASSADVINAFAKEKTFGLIPSVVKADEIRDLIFLLLNTTYFEGTWAMGFDLIQPGRGGEDFRRFTPAGGAEKHVATISKKAFFGYTKTEDAEIVEIPFLSPGGKEFVFYGVLPDRARPDLAPYRESSFWNTTLAFMKGPRYYAEGRVTLPKFSFDYGLKMTADHALTRAMNFEFLFGDAADFSAMKTETSPRAKVGLIKEITRIELDEKGVKAAAAVVVGGMRSLNLNLKPLAFDVRFDRPFAFAIAEKRSGTLLFVGELHDPTAGQ